MMRKVFAAVVAATLVTGLSACSPKTRPAEEQPAMRAGTGTVLTIEDSGTTIDISAGDEFTVSLDENITTGYSWSVRGVLPSLLQTVSDDASAGAAAGTVGAGGTRTIVYRATAPGTARLTLDYIRPWESGNAPEQTFTVALRIL